MPRERFLCIHGHFYQPPRENPWLEAIEPQPSAAPHHNWNARITHECYGPNTAARVVDNAGRIIEIRNNFASISFNVGPTLLGWMEEHAPDVYEEIVAGDRLSMLERGGHGNAIAQVYNHVIMPLASRRDKVTQVLWGMEDFRDRFGRDPDGCWLAETAVDTETLEVLADNGIRFTILSPYQARKWREVGGSGGWRSCDGGRIDTSRAYSVPLPSGKSIAVFFYDGPLSRAVAFEGMLADGVRFARRLCDGFNEARPWPQLVHIATDGESYGHHHRHGEMALAYATHVIESEKLARLTNYGEYLSLHPPAAEAQIVENSSWSCAHGVERWRSDCGCNTGGRPGWNQRWRRPLRQALDVVKAEADAAFERDGARVFKSPWAARDAYIRVINDRTEDAVREFLTEHCRSKASVADPLRALRLLELQRNAMLIYTSCAWFFDDLGGIETLQNLAYAQRVIQLLGPETGIELEGRFAEALSNAQSNDAALGNGADIFARSIRPLLVDLRRVVAHAAMSSHDTPSGGRRHVHCYEVYEREEEARTFGQARIKIGRLRARSRIDGEEIDTVACVLHFGGHDFRCSVVPSLGFAAFEEMRDDIFTTFRKRSMTEVVRAIDRHLGDAYFGLGDLFSEERAELLHRVTREGFARFESTIRAIYEENRKLVEHLRDVGAPPPPAFLAAAEFVLRTRLLGELDAARKTLDPRPLLETAAEAQALGIAIADAATKARLARAVDNIFNEVALGPTTQLCRAAAQFLDVLDALHVRLDLWIAQNICFALLHGRPLPSRLERQTRRGDRRPQDVLPALKELGDRLKVGELPLTAVPVPERAKPPARSAT